MVLFSMMHAACMSLHVTSSTLHVRIFESATEFDFGPEALGVAYY